ARLPGPSRSRTPRSRAGPSTPARTRAVRDVRSRSAISTSSPVTAATSGPIAEVGRSSAATAPATATDPIGRFSRSSDRTIQDGHGPAASRCGAVSGSGRGRVDGAAEAPVAAGVLYDGRLQGVAVYIGPQHVLEDHFGVGGLTEQEVRGPLLTRGAHEQVDIGHTGGVESRSQCLLRDSAGFEPARGDLGGD